MLLCWGASPAQADSGPVADCSGGPLTQTVTGGSPLSVVVQAPVRQRFGVTFNGLARAGDTVYFAPVFPTPIVRSATQLRLVITCSGPAGTVASEFTIIVMPRDAAGPSAAAPDASAQATSRSRPPIILKLGLLTIPALLALAALVLRGRRRPSAR